eukprot:symbB.v1.2.028472.t1/scaffold3006.1/size65522/5
MIFSSPCHRLGGPQVATCYRSALLAFLLGSNTFGYQPLGRLTSSNFLRTMSYYAGPSGHPTGARLFRHKLTPQEEEIIRVSFESFSEESLDAKGEPIKDAKGEVIRVITIDSLQQAFRQIDASGDIHDVQLMIDDIDANNDGRIDYDEWKGIMTRKLLGEDSMGSAPHTFEVLDDNKDDYIPAVELRSILMKEGLAPLSEQEVDELLLFADPDQDGLVNYKEFLRWLSNPYWHHQYKD